MLPCIGGERRRAGERIPGPGVVDPCRPLVFLREMSEAITLSQHHPCLVVQSSPISRARGIIGSVVPDYDTVSVQNRGTFPSRAAARRPGIGRGAFDPMRRCTALIECFKRDQSTPLSCATCATSHAVK